MNNTQLTQYNQKGENTMNHPFSGFETLAIEPKPTKPETIIEDVEYEVAEILQDSFFEIKTMIVQKIRTRNEVFYDEIDRVLQMGNETTKSLDVLIETILKK